MLLKLLAEEQELS